jgi:hypothetical protein
MPPSWLGGLHETLAEVGPAAEALTLVGDPGGAAGVTAFDWGDVVLERIELTAVTLKV